jgi:hypothetical protein
MDFEEAEPFSARTLSLDIPSTSLRACPEQSEGTWLRATLQLWRVPTLGQALDELFVWCERCTLTALYRKYFPTEYARSQANVVPPVNRAGGYSDRELEFLELVNQRLFPICQPEDYLGVDERFPCIPFQECSVEFFDEEDFSSLRMPVQVFVCLIGAMGDDWWKEVLPGAPPIQDGTRDWKYFTRLCRRAGGILTDAPLGLEIVSYSTGNPFFDTTSGMGGDAFGWEPDTMAFLAAEWRKARELNARFDQLIDAFEREPSALVRLVTLWNRAIEKKENKS